MASGYVGKHILPKTSARLFRFEKGYPKIWGTDKRVLKYTKATDLDGYLLLATKDVQWPFGGDDCPIDDWDNWLLVWDERNSTRYLLYADDVLAVAAT